MAFRHSATFLDHPLVTSKVRNHKRMAKTRTVGDITLLFKEESVIMIHNNQCVCFHSWNIKNKNLLRDFTSSLRRSRKVNLEFVYTKARQFDVPSFGISGHSLSVITKQVEEARRG